MYPNRQQQQALLSFAGAARFTYNWGLERWNSMWEAHKADHRKPKPSQVLLSRIWTKEKPSWTTRIARSPVARSLHNLAVAYTRYINKVSDKPKFKCKREGKYKFYIDNNVGQLLQKHIHLPKIGDIKLAQKLRYRGKIQCFYISGCAGRWWVSVSMQLEDIQGSINKNQTIGIDVGLKYPAVASNGLKCELPKSWYKLKKKLSKADRALSRSKKRSNKHLKRLKRLQSIQLKLNYLKHDVTHKFTTKLSENQATLVVESIDISGLHAKANKSLKRCFSSSMMSQILTQCQYKAAKFVRAPKYFASTKICSSCGNVKEEIALEQRVYRCQKCGAVVDRDLNAAINLMKQPWVTG